MIDPQLVVSPCPGPLALSLVCIDPNPNRPTHRRRLRLGTILDCIGTKERDQEMEEGTSRRTYQISSTHTTALASSILEVLRLPHCLLLRFLLIHTCLFPHRESLSSHWREIGAQFVSLQEG